jgi:hypothetical protein
MSVLVNQLTDNGMFIFLNKKTSISKNVPGLSAAFLSPLFADAPQCSHTMAVQHSRLDTLPTQKRNGLVLFLAGFFRRLTDG